MPHQESVSLRLLGPFEVLAAGRLVQAGGPKQRALLCYLIIHAGEPVRIGTLVQAVWGDDPPEGAIASLRTYVSNLRLLLGPGATLRGEKGTYRLDLRSVETDIDSFHVAAKDGAAAEAPGERSRMLGRALDLWRGPFLADMDRPWVQEEASILEFERQRAIVDWAEATLEAGNPAAVVPVMVLAAAGAPLDERLCGLLMRAQYRSGRQADALAVFRRLRGRLAEELGIEPGPELRSLEEQILLHEASMQGPKVQWLPTPITDLVGRSVEIEDLLGLVGRVRLLTLTGPGGIGKTRLAIEVGRRVVERGGESVFFADLSPVADESAVDAVLASSVGVQPHPDSEPLVSLIEYLRPRRALLIVDNCEHLASTVARSFLVLVRSCPQVTLLATSRAPLHIDGELEWRTPPLPLPDRADSPVEVLRQWAAVELLARRAPNSFEITVANRGDVVELCRLLDGLPLALEISASRLGSMTPGEIITSLGPRAQMARGESADRSQTLDATIRWSYELLSDGPRRLFDRLGVMAGRFFFEDVVAVCVSESVSADTARDWLSSLVDQSLVMAETSGPRTRFRLLETIRRFSLGRLDDDESDVRQRHARHFGRLAEFEAARLLTREEGAAAAELSFAYDNLRAGIGWAMESGDVDTASRIVASMPDWGYWRSGYELSQWAKWVWEMTTPADPRWRAVCGSAARGAWLGGRLDEAYRLGSAAGDAAAGTAIARSGHPDDVVADVFLYSGDAQRALDHYAGVAADADQRGDVDREVWATYYVAVINTVLGRTLQAVEAAAKALNVARETGNPTALAFSFYANGLAVKHQSPEEAIGMFEEAVRVADSVGNRWFGGIAGMELASTKADHGDLHGGLVGFAGVIDHWHRVGDNTQLRLSWRYLVRALAAVGLPDEAAILTGALVSDVRSVLTHPHPRLVDKLRDVLGEAEYMRLSIRGSVMSVSELVVMSLDAIDRAQHMPQDSLNVS